MGLDIKAWRLVFGGAIASKRPAFPGNPARRHSYTSHGQIETTED
jgi:hypothetical protein